MSVAIIEFTVKLLGFSRQGDVRIVAMFWASAVFLLVFVIMLPVKLAATSDGPNEVDRKEGYRSLIFVLAFVSVLYFIYDSRKIERAVIEEEQLALDYITNNSQVIKLAGGSVKTYPSSSTIYSNDKNRGRYEFSIVGPKTFYAIVDVNRRSGKPEFNLACVTTLSMGYREAGKDDCTQSAIPLPKLEQFDLAAERNSRENRAQEPTCGFSELKLPAEFVVLAAGAYGGRKIAFQIDQSGQEGTQIDVAVNSPNKPVVLMLGAYEPTIWNIGWSRETKVLAVLASGYHRQAVAGLEKTTPLLVSTYDNRGPCGYFYITPDNLGPLNPLSRRIFGRPVNIVYPATKGKVVVGAPIPEGSKLVTSSETSPESFQDRSAPIAGPVGLEDAVRKGLLRKATATDAEAWADAVAQNSPQRDIPPVAGQSGTRTPRSPVADAYVVLAPFTYPAGLYGGNSATFLIPKGVPKPEGNPGHSSVYDLNTLNCQGPLCSNH